MACRSHDRSPTNANGPPSCVSDLGVHRAVPSDAREHLSRREQVALAGVRAVRPSEQALVLAARQAVGTGPLLLADAGRKVDCAVDPIEHDRSVADRGADQLVPGVHERTKEPVERRPVQVPHHNLRDTTPRRRAPPPTRTRGVHTPARASAVQVGQLVRDPGGRLIPVDRDHVQSPGLPLNRAQASVAVPRCVLSAQLSEPGRERRRRAPGSRSNDRRDQRQAGDRSAPSPS